MIVPFTLLLAAQLSPLTVQIVDEQNRLTPARVYLYDAKGNPVKPPLGAIPYDKTNGSFREAHFVPSSGSFSVPLSKGRYLLTVERGKEYLAYTEPITIPRARPVRVQLTRWIDMKTRGWYSADMHVHRPLADLETLMAAEDLPVAIPITRWRTLHQPSQDPSLQQFLAAAPAEAIKRQSNGFFPILNEELEPRASALLASFLPNRGVALEYPLSLFAAAVKAAGGLVDSEKATSLEFPALAATGDVQLVGLANNHLWRNTSYTKAWGAWPDHMLQPSPATCEGFVRAGFDMFSAVRNAGVPIQLSAGSASGVHPVPLGWSRIYVKSRPDAKQWRQALLTGSTFVTTGPMLLLSVIGRTAEVEVLSPVPITSAELVVNGEATTLRLRKAGPYAYRGRKSLELVKTSWVAARWVSSEGAGCNAAHTSAVTIEVGNQPFAPSVQARAQLKARVQELITRVENNQLGEYVFTETEALRSATLQYLQRAAEFYADVNGR